MISGNNRENTSEPVEATHEAVVKKVGLNQLFGRKEGIRPAERGARDFKGARRRCHAAAALSRGLGEPTWNGDVLPGAEEKAGDPRRDGSAVWLRGTLPPGLLLSCDRSAHSSGDGARLFLFCPSHFSLSPSSAPKETSSPGPRGGAQNPESASAASS